MYIRLHWQEAPLNERKQICAIYAAKLFVEEQVTMTFEELNEAWFGCWYDVIKFTFGRMEEE